MRNKLSTEKEGKQLVQQHKADNMEPEVFFFPYKSHVLMIFISTPVPISYAINSPDI